MKIVETVMERIRELVNVETTQFDFMSGRERTDVCFLRRMQEEYKHKEKNCMCFVNIVRAFHRVTTKVMGWAMRKKDL